MILHQSTDFQFVLEARLRLLGDVLEDRRVLVPLSDSLVVGASTLVVDDEGINAKTQALLHHKESTYTTIVIVKGVDALKLYMEVQNSIQVNREFLVIGRLFLVILDQISKGCVDFLRRVEEIIDAPAIYLYLRHFRPQTGTVKCNKW